MALRPPWTTKWVKSQSRLHIETLPQQKGNGRALSVSKHEPSCPQSPLDYFSLIFVARHHHVYILNQSLAPHHVFHLESMSHRLAWTHLLPWGVLARREWGSGCQKEAGSVMTLAEVMLGRMSFLAHVHISDPLLPLGQPEVYPLCSLFILVECLRNI